MDWLPELIRNHPLGCFGSAIWSTSTNQPCPKKGLPPRSLIYPLKSSLPNKKVAVQPHHFSEAMSNFGGQLRYATHQFYDIGSYFSNQMSDFFAPHVFFWELLPHQNWKHLPTSLFGETFWDVEGSFSSMATGMGFSHWKDVSVFIYNYNHEKERSPGCLGYLLGMILRSFSWELFHTPV